MAETASSVTINDIPEELKPFRKMLLASAFGQVFKPEYIQQYMPNAQFPGATTPQPQTPMQPAQTPTQPVDAMNSYHPIAPTAMAGGSLGDIASALQEQLANRVGYAQGGLASAAEAIEKLLQLGGDVNLGASGTPLGGYTPPMVVSPPPNIPTNIGTGTQPPPTPQPPSVTPPTGSTGGVINTPPSGTLPIGNPNPTPPTHLGGTAPTPTPAPGAVPQPRASVAPPMFLANQPANFAGAAQAQAMGYNPAQYADRSVADDLAEQMGGRTVFTNTGGPIGPPSQAMIDAGGSNMHNAGLIADINRRFADDEGMRNFALDSLRKEIRSYGGDTGGFAAGGIVKMAAGGLNPFSGIDSAAGGMSAFSSPTMTMNSMYSPTNTTSDATPSSALGFGTTSGTAPTPPGLQSGAMNPYQAYGGQRILGMGNQGQTDPNGYLQASDLTRNSLSGYGNLPSYFNSNGTINEGRNAQGEATTPLGIAGDTFNAAGQLALDASRRAGDASYTSPLSSTFGTALGRIAENPLMFQAGDISLGQLTAPQLDAPLGVGTSQLTSYQMAGPRLIDPSGANINPSYVGDQKLNYYQANGPSQVTGSTYNPTAMSGPQNVDTASILRGLTGAQMTQPGNVSSGQATWGKFTDPGVQQAYMDPYQRAVMDVQKQRANQDFAEAKAGRNAAAIKAGAFGGNRQAVADSIAERDKQAQLAQIEATGNEAAFQNAQAQYERDRAASLAGQQFNISSRLNSDLANQQMGYNTGATNLNAMLQQNALAGNIGLQGQLANQQAGLTVAANNQNAINRASEFGAANSQQAALANQGMEQQTGLANLQANLDTQGRESGYRQQGNLANQQAYMDAASKNQQLGYNSQLANQQALQAANQANLAASLGVQELGANQYMQSQLANQQAGLTAGQANQNAALNTQALARNSGLAAAQSNQNTRLSQNTTLLDAMAKADQLQQQAAQGNFSNQLAGMGQQTNSALAANTIGQNRADLGRLAQAQELLRLQSMGQAGAGVDTRTQGALDLGYQDWTNQQNYPYQQMNWLQSILSGTPMGYNQEGVQFQKTNPLAQIAGLGTAAAGAYGAYKGN